MTKLEEGKEYIFNALKIIDLPGSERNLLLMGPDKRKYLIPLQYYGSYGLMPGIKIKCKVDKINCSGKVFLEPQHPYYSEGKEYDFTVESFSSVTNEKGQNEAVACLRDKLGNIAFIKADRLPGDVTQGSTIKLDIERISKGKIYFRQEKEPDSMAGLKVGKTYRFTIERIAQNPEGEEFFVTADIYGNEHLLPVRYYAHYGMKQGDSFEGRIIRFGAGMSKSIEPENPWFKPGDILDVTIGSIAQTETGDGYLAEAFDARGFKHYINIDFVPDGQTLRCSVLRIKKGKPVLAVCR